MNFLFWSKSGKTSVKNYRNLCSEIIKSVPECTFVSSYDILMTEIDQTISCSKKDFESFSGQENLEELALNSLINYAAPMVSSGRYHVYTGVLKPVGEHLQKVCIHCLSEKVKKGFMTPEMMQVELTTLRENIAHIG